MHSLWTVKHFCEQFQFSKLDRLTKVLYFFTAQWKYKSYSNIEIHKTQIMALELMLEVMQARSDINYI